MNDASSVGWLGLAASTTLIALTVAISLWKRLGLAASVVWSCARATGQLLLVGLALVVVFDGDAMWLAWLWVLIMIGFAVLTIRQRAGPLPGVVATATVAMLAVAVASLGVLFGLGIVPLTARALVPLAGMMLGNSLAAAVLVTRRMVAEMRDHQLEIEARLALGQPSRQASGPFVRNGLRDSITPQIESTKALGLVVLPGTMTGLILAGVEPLDAVQLQLAVMFLVLGSVATSVTVMGLGLSRRMFSADHRFVFENAPYADAEGGHHPDAAT